LFSLAVNTLSWCPAVHIFISLVIGRVLGLNPASQDTTADGISDLLPRIEAALVQASSFSAQCPEKLGDAIRYSLLAPGKRVRPSLALMACEAVGGKVEEALPGAVAVEMIHAYSLVHDDLPAMDDDDLRRGRPTTHIQFDEATAILAGDSLLAMAFEHLATAIPNPILAHRCMRVLGHAAGPECLVGGQSEDLAAENGGPQTLERLESIHRRKTGALIDASVAIGGILGGADEAGLTRLANYSRPLGLAFQVVDDCLDHSASDEEMGKRTGKDAARGKLTYPGLMGLSEARTYSDRLISQAIEAIDVFGSTAWRLKSLAGYVRDRKR
jgi:geranylgeranyl diphosphate synthase type II